MPMYRTNEAGALAFKAMNPAPRPGKVNSLPPGMYGYLIILDEREADSADYRKDPLGHNQKRNHRVRVEVERLLRQRSLEAECDHISEPMHLPFLVMVATPKVAEAVRDLQGVEHVMEDAGLDLVEAL